MPGFEGMIRRVMVKGTHFTLTWHKIEPGTKERLHSHKNEQATYVQEGRTLQRWKEGGKEKHVIIGPNESIYYPAGVPHAVSVVGKRPAIVLDVHAPPPPSANPIDYIRWEE